MTHYRLGNVRMDIAVGLGLGAVVGGYFGAQMANLMPELWLRVLFAAVGIWMGLRYVQSK